MEVDGLSVTISQDGADIVEYVPGTGGSAIRSTDEVGQYIVNVNTRALGMAAGDYEIVVAFDHGGDTWSTRSRSR